MERSVLAGDRVTIEVRIEGMPLTTWVQADVREVWESLGLVSVVAFGQGKSIPYVAKIEAISSNRTAFEERLASESAVVKAKAMVEAKVVLPHQIEQIEYGDYFLYVDDFADRLENYVPEEEWPESVFVAGAQPLYLPKYCLEDYTERWAKHFDKDDIKWHGSNEFQAAIEVFHLAIAAFELANTDRTSSYPSTKQKIMVADLMKGYVVD